MIGRGIRGLVGQLMSGERPALTPVGVIFPISTTMNWTVPQPGWYRFIVWAGGDNGAANTHSGGAGQLYIAERPLAKGQRVIVTSGGIAAASTVALPGGEVITAAPASGINGGSSTTLNQMTDVKVNGPSGAFGQVEGPSGPTYLNYFGGAGGTGGTGTNARVPAGGGGAGSTGGAPGLVIAHQVRLQR